jgi:hypothetical protein
MQYAPMRSAECILADGGTPEPFARQEFPCAKCGAVVTNRSELASVRAQMEAA